MEKKSRNKIEVSLALSFALYCCQLFFRVFEYVHLDPFLKATYSFLELYTSSFYQDVFISIAFFCFSFLLLHLTKVNSWMVNLLRLLVLVLLIVQFSLSEYFNIMQAPLDETIYKFTSHELSMITGTGSRLNLNVMMHLLTVTACFLLLEFAGKKLRFKRLFFLSVFLFMSSILSPFVFFRNGQGEERYAAASNKLYYFLESSATYFLKGENYDKTYKITDFQSLDPRFIASGNVENEFPLLHKINSQSQLGNYLEKKSSPPNIVLIIVESLSSDLVGKYAHKTGNIMPFLDSLSRKSLYFPNFLSTCERTHNVLPAVLASVPNAPNGEILMKMNSYPDHLSLVSLLKKSYYSRFYCGVDLVYNKMNSYMNYLQTDYLVGNWEKKFTSDPFFKSNTWGHPDGVLFEKSHLDLLALKKNQRPRLDVFLTISTHDPFDYPSKEIYTNRLRQKIKNKKLAPYYRSKMNRLAGKYASFVYFDDQLRRYFSEAKKNTEEFENTIFMICGDHGSELCYEDALSKFRIPLIIYSPLIQQPQEFPAINSHLNIAPTMLSYLKNEHRLSIPENSSFIGGEIDFSKTLTLNKIQCFNSHQLKNEYLLYNNYFLDRNNLYKLNKQFQVKKVRSEKVKQKLKSQLVQYNNLASYLYFENKMVDSQSKNTFLYRKPFTTFYDFKEAVPLQDDLKKEFIPIGADHFAIPLSTQQIRLTFSCSVYLTKRDSLEQLPTMVMAIKNAEKDIFWNSTKAFFPEKIAYNKWNKAKFEITVHLNDLEKLKKSNALHFYLYNTAKREFKARNFNTAVEFQKK